MSRLPNLALGVDRRAGVGAIKRLEITPYAAHSEIGQNRPEAFKLYENTRQNICWKWEIDQFNVCKLTIYPC